MYQLSSHEEVDCKASSCSLVINSSHVTRGSHPYIVITSNEYQDSGKHIPTLVVVPLTSQTTFLGLSDVYPINKTVRNSLPHKSYALVHQICTVDANCFKDSNGNWKERMGQLDKQDRKEIETRLKYVLGIGSNPSEDWFKQNATPALVQKIYGHLTEEEKSTLVESLIEALE